MAVNGYLFLTEYHCVIMIHMICIILIIKKRKIYEYQNTFSLHFQMLDSITLALYLFYFLSLSSFLFLFLSFFLVNYITRSMLSRCGGSLISRLHVVTAGHCVARATPRQVHVTLGDYVINSAVEPMPAYTFGVRSISVHPYFKFTPQADRFDVAVLRLERPVHYMPHIGKITD